MSFDPSAGSNTYIQFEFSDYPTQDPINADFDFDGFSNLTEIQNNTSPTQYTAGGGVPPLQAPEIQADSSFVLRKIVIDDNADPKRVVEDYQLDEGFNEVTGANFPGGY